MNAEQYQKAAIKMAIYPGRGTENITYPVLKLNGEVSELTEKAVTQSPREEIAKEIGDCAWYVAAICEDMGIQLQELRNMGGPSGIDILRTHNDILINLFIQTGSIAEQYGKALRDDGGVLSDERRTVIVDHMIRVFTWLRVIAGYYDYTMEEIFQMNLDKLADRAVRGKLGGAGDNR